MKSEQILDMLRHPDVKIHLPYECDVEGENPFLCWNWTKILLDILRTKYCCIDLHSDMTYVWYASAVRNDWDRPHEESGKAQADTLEEAIAKLFWKLECSEDSKA